MGFRLHSDFILPSYLPGVLWASLFLDEGLRCGGGLDHNRNDRTPAPGTLQPIGMTKHIRPPHASDTRNLTWQTPDRVWQNGGDSAPRLDVCRNRLGLVACEEFSGSHRPTCSPVAAGRP